MAHFRLVESSWLPIEDAPRDGTPIYVRYRDHFGMGRPSPEFAVVWNARDEIWIGHPHGGTRFESKGRYAPDQWRFWQ